MKEMVDIIGTVYFWQLLTNLDVPVLKGCGAFKLIFEIFLYSTKIITT